MPTAPFTKGNKPAFHTPLDNFAKLRLWELEDSTKTSSSSTPTPSWCRNIDRLFAYPGILRRPERL